MKSFSHYSNENGGYLIPLKACSVLDELDRPLSHFEVVYQEVNHTPSRTVSIDENGITDISSLADTVIDFVIEQYPHLEYKMEAIRNQNSIATLVKDVYEILSSNYLDSDFYITYMFANPLRNNRKYYRKHCIVCGLNPVTKYGAAGVGLLTEHLDIETKLSVPVCPTCQTLLTNRDTELSVKFLKSLTEEDHA